MKTKDPSDNSRHQRFTPVRIIFILVCLAAAGAAGVALRKSLWTDNVAVEQTGARRFAGRTGNSSTSPGTRLSKNAQFLSQSRVNADGTITGAKIIMDAGIERSVRDIMRQQAATPADRTVQMKPEREIEREEKKNNPAAPEVAQWPVPAKGQQQPTRLNAPQTTALVFDGPTLSDTSAFPPDTMGAVGPTQFVAFENGRIRTYTKAGVADGVINASPNVFFASVMTPVSGSVVSNFTSDPNVRYDRFTKRWFMTIIDVPCTNISCTATAANRLMIAVSDAASNGTITAGTVWTFFQFVGDPGTNFLDYPSLGVDVNALYIGGNMFSSAGSFVGCNAYVVQKSSILGAGPGVATAFANIATGSVAGPFSPRGVDNLDSGATEGYFVGVDTLVFSLIQFRRVFSPGSVTPTLSANISVTVPSTGSPNLVEHAGNTGGTNGNLDSLDDRLYAAMIRNGRLWTAHNFRVSAAGLANTSSTSRNASRWYEFQNLTATPLLVQSGTVFDNAATRAAARQYFIPSVAVSGQGHAVLGFTMAGTPVGATPAYVGRLAGDTLGTMDGPPNTAAVAFGTSTSNYNPAGDPGGGGGRRWGDYSYISLDPLDDMTLWAIQEYNHASNSYAVRVAKLAAPPPATLSTASPSSITAGQTSVNVTITGTSSGGSGFYDPGANLPAPALPFNHIAASVTGGVTVNSVTYNSPTSITLNLSTVGASVGAKNVTVTNPDGQGVTTNGLLTVTGACPTITGTVGGGGTICAGGSTNVTVTVSGGTPPYTVTLTNSGGSQTGNGPLFTFPVSPGANTTYAVAAGSQDGNGCPITGSGSAAVNVSAQPTTANAGPDQNVCATSATLAANTPMAGTGAWSIISGAGGSFVNAASPTTAFNGTAGTTYTLRWTISNAPCTASTDDVVITLTANPTTANAGPDQTLCATSATLAANTPTVGTGAWSIISGAGGTVTTASSPTSGFTGAAGTTYTLRWTISNSPCTASTDDVVITFTAPPTTANAGPDQTLCATSATLAANTPTVGTGAWSIISGAGGSFVNAASPTTAFNGTAGTTYTLRWTISNAPCTASTDDVVITLTANPTTANAGPDQTLCATSATLAANTPTVGTGAWSIISGAGGTVTTASSPTSGFTGTAGTTYTLRWTISNSPCTASTDDVVITLTANPTTANAGPDQTLCATSATLAANTPTVGTGAWIIISGAGGSFVNAASPTTAFNGTAGTTYTLRWTISNAPCTASTDDVVITFTAPPTFANAGTNQTLCNTSVSGVLAANTPAIGTGAWSVVNGPSTSAGQFSSTGNPAATFTPAGGAGVYTLRWTISNLPCAASTSDVTLTFNAAPTVANAGPDQSFCTTSPATLAANTPGVGVGAWSVVSGPSTSAGQFNNTGDPAATFTPAGGVGVYTLRWTISNSPCAASTDDVMLTFTSQSTAANAGPDQTLCTTAVVATLAANSPGAGTGAWSVVSGPSLSAGQFSNTSNPGAAFTPAGGAGVYTLRWTISNPPCAPSTDDVVITFNAPPTVASAGPDQTLCTTSPAVLAANTPGVGTGAWSVVSGPSTSTGQFNSTGDPSATFTPAGGAGVYTLRWTIGNAPCTASTDDVVIIFNAVPTVADAGADQTLCRTTSAATLAANTPATGTGVWSVVSGPSTSAGQFSSTGNPSAAFTPAGGAGVYTLRWTISNAPCTASTDDVVIAFNAVPTTANAGPDQTLCATSATLEANTPTVGTGAWSIISGAGGTVTTSSSPTSGFTGTAGTTYTLRWTISNSPCTDSSDDVVITLTANPTAANAGPDQAFCGTSAATLAANTPGIGTGAWTVVTGPSTSASQFSSVSSPAATFTPAGGTGVYTLRWTISNAPCTDSTDDVVLTYDVVPTITLGASPSVFPGTTSANLTYSATGGSPNQYSIDYNAAANTAGFADVTNAALPASPIVLVVPGAAASGVYNATLTVRNSTTGCVSIAAAFTVTVATCPTITVSPSDSALPAGRSGTPYNQTFTQTGGAGNVVFSVSTGDLPAGLTLSPGGVLSGAPTVFGSFGFSVRATDANNCFGERAYSLTIHPPCTAITIAPVGLPNGFQGTAYSQTLTATGGGSPYSFTVTAGALPNGLSLSTGGLLSGTPTGSGNFSFTVTATDNTGCIGTGSYTVIVSGAGLMFYPLPQPVRLLETRAGFNGCTTPGAPINTGGTLSLPARTTCAGIPAGAQAVTGNITVVPQGPGFLTLFPSTATQPTVANSNFASGEITNNVFTVGLGAGDGAFKIFSSATTHVIVDVTGYYAPPAAGGLYFHPLSTPVRLLETRAGFAGCFAPGAPLVGNGDPNADPNLDLPVQGRSPIPSPCNSIPASAQVLVGNATSVFPGGGGYLTIYPSGGNRPLAASSNYAGNDVINGPFAVKLGADGKFKIYTLLTTHLVVDILGYYSEEAVDANGAGLLFNPLPAPVRLLETRPGGPPLTGCTRTNAPIQGNINAATHTQQARDFCGLPASAQAVVGNVSVVNTAGAGFLTLFPSNLTTAPLVATSNYPAPATFGYNRHYFVGLSPVDGNFKVLTQFTTDLILDASGYFAP